jgi:hypothetical protein
MKPTPSAVSLLAHVIPPRHAERNPVVLEAAMQSLALSQRHPVALEIAGTANYRRFFLRATTDKGYIHALAQLRARYPQAGILRVKVEDDPLRLADDEAVSVVELAAGNASYLPLRTWQEEDMKQEGLDPLLGVLAALDGIPEGMRVVAQIGMAPAAPAWSRSSQRRAVEHPLEPERERERLMLMQARLGQGAPSTASLMALALVFVGISLLAHVRAAIPPWIGAAALAVALGRPPALSHTQFLLLLFWGSILLLGILLSLLLFFLVKRHMLRRAIYDQKLVTQKTMRMAYRVRIRLYVIAPRPLFQRPFTWRVIQEIRRAARERRERLLQLVAAYRQFHLASGNYFVAHRLCPWSARWLLTPPEGLLRSLGGWWRGIGHSRHYIGVDTLALLWHLPQGEALSALPLVEQRRTRSFPLPPPLLQMAPDGEVIGEASHAGSVLPFTLPPECLEVHTLIGGKSGEGKSTCIEHLAHALMCRGSGLLLIDPHGDLSEHVLSRVPEERSEDVVWIDLADPAYSVGLNPLDVTLGRGRDKAVADLLHTLSHIWMRSWGPRMENAFEMALRTLYEANRVLVANHPQNGPDQQYTLLDVLPLLTDESFCHALLQPIDDPFLSRWWFSYYDPLSLTQQRDIINPVISKTTKFESALARRIVGQGCSTLNFSQFIREQKILLVKLAKGETGSDVAPLLGATILGLVQVALEEQAALAEEERVRLPIIIDEFQTLEGTDYGALAELRKYGATFFLATQSFDYLRRFQPALLATVLSNVNQFIIYHMSAEDAQVIHQELGVEPEDITTLSRHLCYIRLVCQGQRQPVFSVQLSVPPAGDASQALSIRLRSQQQYAHPVAEVDEQLRNAVIRTLATSQETGQREPSTPVGEADTPLEAPAAPPVSMPAANKKRKGEWVKGGRKNQPKQLVPSAFAESEAAETAGAPGEREEEQAKDSPDEKEDEHEPIL